MQQKSQRRILVLLLVVCMSLSLLPGLILPVFAGPIGTNAYGTNAEYTPVRSLYTTVAHPSYVAKGGSSNATLTSFKLFDAKNTVWDNVPTATRSDKASASTWLLRNNYLLNKFGYRRDDSYKFMNHMTYNYTSSIIQKQSNTKIFPGNLQVGFNQGSFVATYNFEGLSWQDSTAWSDFEKNTYGYAIANMNHVKTGNIGNMINKGDIEYFLAFELDGYSHSCAFCSSYDTSILKIFEKQYKSQSYEAFNYTRSGPDFGVSNAWFPANKLTTLYYSGDSGHDEKISAKLTNAILVGRDKAGPRIENIKVTTDRDGENELPGGAVSLNNIGNLTDRTIYFQVTWDEPVLFKDLTSEQISSLKLQVQTLGIDGTSGIITEAPFLKFTPKASDSVQMMTFEYRIPDPYTGSGVSTERGYFYKFTKATVSNAENKEFWNNIVDISGNKFAANSNGVQPGGKVEYGITGSPFVDLRPFAIENIKVKKDKSPDKEFVEHGELLSVTLEFNKNFANKAIGRNLTNNYFYNGANFENLPSITLNVKDEMGINVKITPTNPSDKANQLVKKIFDGNTWQESDPIQQWTTLVQNQNKTYWPLSAVSVNDYTKRQVGWGYINYEVNSVTYNVQLYPGYTIEEDSIKVIKVTPSSGAKDSAGYQLMDYELKEGGFLEPTNLPAVAAGKIDQYRKAVDKNYKLDFTPPVIDVSVSDEDNGIIKVKADISDQNLWGCDAAFDLKVEGNVEGNIEYQPSSSGTYDGDKWVKAPEGSTRIGVNSPVIGSTANRNAYVFIKLPDKSEVGSVSAAVTIADEARNSTTGLGILSANGGSWTGIDNLPPVVSLIKDGEDAKVTIKDMSTVEYVYQWEDTFEADGTTRKVQPSSYTESGFGYDSIISYLVSEENKIHHKTLWVKSKDSNKNESDPVSMDFAFNKTYAEIQINSTGTSTGKLTKGDEVKANVTLKNVKCYWYIWLEKPTDYIWRNNTLATPEYNINYGDAAAFAAGKGWGVSGSLFNNWNPLDFDKKVEGTVGNQNFRFMEDLSIMDMIPGTFDDQDEEAVEEEISGDNLDSQGGDPSETLTDGDLFRDVLFNSMGSGEAYINETTLDIELNYHKTQVVKHSEEFEKVYEGKWEITSDIIPETILAKDSTRPLVLLIAVEDTSDDQEPGTTPGNLRFAAIEFDTFYNEPQMAVRQVRFSSNDGKGNRRDYERQLKTVDDVGEYQMDEGLYWPGDKFDSNDGTNHQSELMINATTFHDFGEAEFYLGADPATGLDRLPDDGIKIEMRKEFYRATFKEEKENDQPTKLVFYDNFYAGFETSKPPITVQQWIIKKDDLTKAYLHSDRTITGFRNDFPYGSEAYRFTLKIDPSLVDAVPYEIHDLETGEPEVWCVRYGFYAVSDYQDDLGMSEEMISQFIFDNTFPSARLESINNEEDPIRGGRRIEDDLPISVEAVFEIDSSFEDITASVPLVTFSGSNEPTLEFEFCDSGLDLNGPLPWIPSPYMPLMLAARDSKNSLIGSQPAVRLGKTDSLELHQGRVRFNDTTPCVEFSFDKKDYIAPLIYTAGLTLEEFDSSLIYYQFYDEIRGTESPIYVVNIRRDETPPVVELSVSETENPVGEVRIKVDDLYDLHPMTEGEITTYVVDTPLREIKCEVNAWREVEAGEIFNTTDEQSENYYDKDEDFRIYYNDEDREDLYVRVKPDQDGMYTFIRNGHMHIVAMDGAYNVAEKMIVNGGEPENPSETEWGIVYEVNNIDLDPPKFKEEPTWVADAAGGKFTLTAKADETAVATYIRFDKEYMEFLTGDKYDEHEVTLGNGETLTVPSSQPLMFGVGSIPGQLGGSFDPVTGEINLTVYAKAGAGEVLKSAAIILVDRAGNEMESVFDFGAGISGVEPKITNDKTGVVANVNDYPVYNYGGELNFSAPVMIDMYNTGFALEHKELPIYGDGTVALGYVDLFGGTYVESFYANIFGPGFNHSIKLYIDDVEMDTSATINKQITNKDITVKVDTSGTEGLTINDSQEWQTTVTENGSVSYTLINSAIGVEKTFVLPITSIDKDIPEAYINTVINSSVNEDTGETSIYAITYEITGFSKRNVTVIDEEGNSAPLSITFDKSSESKTYTLRYRDEAGNIGLYPIDVSDINFSDPEDTTITKYRLTFSGSGKDGANSFGTYTWGDEPISLGIVNSEVVVKAEAINAAGEIVPASMSLIGTAPSGVTVFPAQKSVLFTLEKETEQNVTVKLTGAINNIEVPITLPGGTIDKTAPTATIYYSESGSNIKAYLVPSCLDLAVDGINVTGQKSDGRELKLEKDDIGYYVNFDVNGSGYFMMKDQAGNIGTVAIIVATIDNDSPGLGTEGWSGVVEASSKSSSWVADLNKILNTPTNNPIKVFFSFNEQLSRAEVIAYDNSRDLNKLVPSEDYVTALVSGNTVTIEFKQNCQAKISIYDLRGNETILWRPEDGPITSIDRVAPELEVAYPKETFKDNIVTISYKFKNNEEVMLLNDSNGGYKNEHAVKFEKNGQFILTFTDRAGNVMSHYPQIDQIDELAPHIKMSLDFVGDGKEVAGKDEKGNAFYYTNKDVRILLNVDDDVSDDLTVTAVKQGGREVTVTKENLTANDKNYTHYLRVSENGVYPITAKDEWGHENIVYANVTIMDKTPPTIIMASTKAITVEKNADVTGVKNSVLQGVSAIDAQSGVNGGVQLDADMLDVDLANPGSYVVKITATDRLDNKSEKTRTVNVLRGDLRIFEINGQPLEANDVFITTPKQIIVSTNHPSFRGEKVNLYYAQGYKTAAQMKYATPFDGFSGFNASIKGNYTILAQSAEREMFLIYVYVY